MAYTQLEALEPKGKPEENVVICRSSTEEKTRTEQNLSAFRCASYTGRLIVFYDRRL